MKAVFLKEAKSGIQISDIPTPTPLANEQLVRVLNSALNHRDVYISQGLYAKIQWPVIPGSDACVINESTQKKYIINPNFNWGENERAQSADYQILGMPSQGTMAEYISIPKSNLVEKPSHLSDAEAAALPLAGLTAYRALINKGEAKAGDRVFISGIGGGVALMAMQFALAIGCEVYVSSSSSEKINQAISLGAKGGYLYTDSEWHKACLAEKLGFDVIIDSAGGSGFNSLVSICNPGARICIYGGTRGQIENLSPQVLFWKQISILGTSMGSDQDFEQMVKLVNQYQIKPVVQDIFPLDEAAKAFEKMDQGQQFGKIVLSHS